MKTNAKENLKKTPFRKSTLILLLAVFIIAGALLLFAHENKHDDRTRVLTIATLERIVNESKLSTFSAIYNGIAVVANEEHPEKVEYYVSYEAKVNAGIDFDEIQFNMDNEAKQISVILPEVYITKVNVDITTMDYMFVNKSLNTSAISADAYRACEEDAERETEGNESIIILARQNAENIMRGLIEPFTKQIDPDYKLELSWGMAK